MPTTLYDNYTVAYLRLHSIQKPVMRRLTGSFMYCTVCGRSRSSLSSDSVNNDPKENFVVFLRFTQFHTSIWHKYLSKSKFSQYIKRNSCSSFTHFKNKDLTTSVIQNPILTKNWKSRFNWIQAKFQRWKKSFFSWWIVFN